MKASSVLKQVLKYFAEKEQKWGIEYTYYTCPVINFETKATNKDKMRALHYLYKFKPTIEEVSWETNIWGFWEKDMEARKTGVAFAIALAEADGD